MTAGGDHPGGRPRAATTWRERSDDDAVVHRARPCSRRSTLPQQPATPSSGPFRMPVQDVYKFTNDGDDRRIVAGTSTAAAAASATRWCSIRRASGRASSRSRRSTASRRRWPAPASRPGFTLAQQIYVTRGELATLAHEPQPVAATRIRASIFWLGDAPLEVGRSYTLKLGTARVSVQVEHIERVLDASTLESVSDRDARSCGNEVADCVLQAPPSDRFRSGAPTRGDEPVRARRRLRASAAAASSASAARRRGVGARPRAGAQRVAWASSLVAQRAPRGALQPARSRGGWSGDRADRARLARSSHACSTTDGWPTSSGCGNLICTCVDADARQAPARRIGSNTSAASVRCAHLMLDAGLDPRGQRGGARRRRSAGARDRCSGPKRVLPVWLGDGAPGFACDLVVRDATEEDAGCDAIKTLLQDRGDHLPA